jgi:hypothetical protein
MKRAPQCCVCRHPERGRLESLLAGGASQRSLARKFDLGYRSIFQHWKFHVHSDQKAMLVAGPSKLAELSERAAEAGMSVLDYASKTHCQLQARFDIASEACDAQTMARLAGPILECLRIIGALSGQMQRAGASVTNNIAIFSGPVMAELRTMLIRRLAPYPAQAAAVIEGLDELSQRFMAQGQTTGTALLEAQSHD